MNLDLILKECIEVGIIKDHPYWLKALPIVEEIAYGIIPKIHENKCFSFGSMMVEHQEDIADYELIPMEETDLEVARKLSNGSEWFTLFISGNFRGLIKTKRYGSDELTLIRNYPVGGGLIFSRNKAGVVKFFSGDRIITHQLRNWITSENHRMLEISITHCIPKINKSVLSSILEFVLHELAPLPRQGGILIWKFNGISNISVDPLSKLNITNEGHQKMILSYIAQLDGATIINHSGQVIGSGIHLSYSKKSSRIISEYKGTRHTSALRYSYDHADSIVFAVSEDGPVSIFFNGSNITHHIPKSAHSIARKKNKHQTNADKITYANTYIYRCIICGKTNLVEELTRKNQSSPTSIACPTCHQKTMNTSGELVDIRPFYAGSIELKNSQRISISKIWD